MLKLLISWLNSWKWGKEDSFNHDPERTTGFGFWHD